MKVIRTIYEHWRYPKADNEHNIENFYDPDRLYRYKRNFKTFVPSCKGGLTICRLVLDNGDEIIGTAHCNLVDNFNYRLGRKIAHGRALKRLGETYQLDLKQQFGNLFFMQNETENGTAI
jgi:hypothetical protein